MEFESHPAVKQIGERPLYVGNADAASPRHSPSTDYVLTLCIAEQPTTTHHRSLVDSERVKQEKFNEAVNTAVELHNRDGSLFVHCAAGVSRSPTVVATLLATTEDRTFDDAIEEVKQHRERANPHPALRDCALAYLGESL